MAVFEAKGKTLNVALQEGIAATEHDHARRVGAGGDDAAAIDQGISWR